MAKILYGVMGNTNGHIMRTFSLITRIPEHEFHLVAGGRVLDVNNGRYPLLQVPVLHSRYKNQKLDLWGTIYQIALRIFQIPCICWKIHKLVKKIQPDVIVSDREFFTPIYARLTGRKCYSVDHTHILKVCDFPVPENMKKIHALTMFHDNLLFDFTKENFIVSFFQPPMIERPGFKEEVFGGVVRPEVDGVKASEGEHIFVYLTVPDFPELIEALQQCSRPVIFYGYGREGVDGNITYRGFSKTQILEELASCRYAIVNGGHNLLSEALHFGKPAMCFPISGAVEQYINVHFMRELKYGDYTYSKSPTVDLFEDFDKHCDEYQASIKANYRGGTEDLVARLREVFESSEK